MTLDEWIELNVPKLSAEIECHIKQTSLSEDEADFLLRIIMISIRYAREFEL